VSFKLGPITGDFF